MFIYKTSVIETNKKITNYTWHIKTGRDSVHFCVLSSTLILLENEDVEQRTGDPFEPSVDWLDDERHVIKTFFPWDSI